MVITVLHPDPAHEENPNIFIFWGTLDING